MKEKILAGLLALGIGAASGGVGYAVTNNYNQADIKDLNTHVEQIEKINTEQKEENISLIGVNNDLKSSLMKKQSEIENLNSVIEKRELKISNLEEQISSQNELSEQDKKTIADLKAENAKDKVEIDRLNKQIESLVKTKVRLDITDKLANLEYFFVTTDGNIVFRSPDALYLFDINSNSFETLYSSSVNWNYSTKISNGNYLIRSDTPNTGVLLFNPLNKTCELLSDFKCLFSTIYSLKSGNYLLYSQNHTSDLTTGALFYNVTTNSVLKIDTSDCNFSCTELSNGDLFIFGRETNSKFLIDVSENSLNIVSGLGDATSLGAYYFELSKNRFLVINNSNELLVFDRDTYTFEKKLTLGNGWCAGRQFIEYSYAGHDYFFTVFGQRLFGYDLIDNVRVTFSGMDDIDISSVYDSSGYLYSVQLTDSLICFNNGNSSYLIDFENKIFKLNGYNVVTESSTSFYKVNLFIDNLGSVEKIDDSKFILLGRRGFSYTNLNGFSFYEFSNVELRVEQFVEHYFLTGINDNKEYYFIDSTADKVYVLKAKIDSNRYICVEYGIGSKKLCLLDLLNYETTDLIGESFNDYNFNCFKVSDTDYLMSTSAGLYCFDFSTNNFNLTSDSLTNCSFVLAENLCIVVNSENLYLFDISTKTISTMGENLSGYNYLEKLSDNSLLFYSSANLIRFYPDTKIYEIVVEKSISKILTTFNDGSLLLTGSTDDSGLLRYYPSTKLVETITTDGSVGFLKVLSNGQVLLGNGSSSSYNKSTKGLNLYNPSTKEFVNLYEKFELISSFVKFDSFCFDLPNGNLLIYGQNAYRTPAILLFDMENNTIKCLFSTFSNNLSFNTSNYPFEILNLSDKYSFIKGGYEKNCLILIDNETNEILSCFSDKFISSFEEYETGQFRFYFENSNCVVEFDSTTNKFYLLYSN